MQPRDQTPISKSSNRHAIAHIGRMWRGFATVIDRLIATGRKLLEGRLFERPEPLESRQELSLRYLRELQELIDDGEIDVAAAERIRCDLFEEGVNGNRLKLAVYQSYLTERTGTTGPRLVRIDGQSPDAD